MGTEKSNSNVNWENKKAQYKSKYSLQYIVHNI